MITISACMIVKDEEKVLGRCLECLADLVDEIVIVDTGSTDRTKEIASIYTDKIYDWKWNDDFAAARNFSFEKASMDYIYTADADEVIDEINQQRFLQMKEAILPEIEIVQMYYTNQLSYNTTYNFDKEYRPKLYKRLRTFEWVEPIHEMVRLDPVIWDSEIEIIHAPISVHSARDFHLYHKVTQSEEGLSPRLEMMYARELFIVGQTEDFAAAQPYFDKVYQIKELDEKRLRVCECVLAKAARLSGDDETFIKICLKHIATGHSASEICYELGEYYREQKDYGEALLWYDGAAFESEAELDVRYQVKLPQERIDLCMDRMTQWRSGGCV